MGTTPPKRSKRRYQLPRYPNTPHASGQARVKWRGVTYYLGKYGTPESHARFHELLAKIFQDHPELRRKAALLEQRRKWGSPVKPRFVFQLIQPYLNHCASEPSLQNTLSVTRSAARWLVEYCGQAPIQHLRPLLLEEFARHLAQKLKHGTARGYLNGVRRMLRWWSVREVIDPALLPAFEAITVPQVKGMESESKLPVADQVYQQTVRFMEDPWRTMAQLQRDCGMRPSEVLNMKLEDIRRDGNDFVWVPAKHKTARKKKVRAVVIPPEFHGYIVREKQARQTGYVFTRSRRGSRLSPESYCKAIRRAVERAAKQGIELPVWTPGQLRHSAADEFATTVGPRDAQILMGHAKLDTLNIYLSSQIADAKRARQRLEKARRKATLDRKDPPGTGSPASDTESPPSP